MMHDQTWLLPATKVDGVERGRGSGTGECRQTGRPGFRVGYGRLSGMAMAVGSGGGPGFEESSESGRDSRVFKRRRR